ncbi:unnamed protein product [Euphydryas editha]|uniref:Uncharacterized protein n=1 Tax=Euphydryas editha TaxID=104508 RepID=A0AAU9UT07_EUPED|nr:unnamed protein product [Euphydryas editha]
MDKKPPLNIISVYAPQTGCPSQEKQEFWDDFGNIPNSISPGELKYIGGDLNGHVITQSSPSEARNKAWITKSVDDVLEWMFGIFSPSIYRNVFDTWSTGAEAATSYSKVTHDTAPNALLQKYAYKKVSIMAGSSLKKTLDKVS